MLRRMEPESALRGLTKRLAIHSQAVLAECAVDCQDAIR